MLLRIDTYEIEGTTVIQVAGHLVGDGVAELAATLQRVSEPWVVDLSLLRRLDAQGIKVLRSVVQAGGQLLNASPYIQMTLNQTFPSFERGTPVDTIEETEQ